MVRETKTRMIEGAALLLAKNGLQGTSFSEVLTLTGAPRGSVYHHFPDGKDQMVAAAVDFAGARALAFLDEAAGQDAVALTKGFLALWRSVLTRSHHSAGCAVLAVTVAAESTELMDAASTVFRTWRARLAELLEADGVDSASAARFAATLIAASEGAVVMSRADRDLVAFELVADQLVEQANQLTR